MVGVIISGTVAQNAEIDPVLQLSAMGWFEEGCWEWISGGGEEVEFVA